MFDYFFPDRYIASTYVIDFEKMYEKGVRGQIFDIDNTLVPHGAPADKRAVELFARLKKIGFRCCLISNNQEPRVKMFNEKIQVDYIYNAHKPSTKNYRRAMEIMGTKEESTVFIGDQLFTDVWGAKRAGISLSSLNCAHWHFSFYSLFLFYNILPVFSTFFYLRLFL